jgi:hypothetical protein
MTDLWPWLLLAGLGAYHGLNPAMGWLFAVALGLHRRSTATVIAALPPIAVGHLLSIAVVATVVIAAGTVIEQTSLRWAAGLLLIAWAAYHHVYGHRHKVRVGMTAGWVGLASWSFAMATAHGAGLMIVPALMPLCLSGSDGAGTGSSLSSGIAAVGLHSGAMLVVTAAIALAVYRWVGLAILRSAWINLDLVWTTVLAVTGLFLMI